MNIAVRVTCTFSNIHLNFMEIIVSTKPESLGYCSQCAPILACNGRTVMERHRATVYTMLARRCMGEEYYVKYQNYCTMICNPTDTLQFGRQSWLMKAAGPRNSWARFFRDEYITLKSFTPGWRNCVSSSCVIVARQQRRPSIFFPFNLHQYRHHQQYPSIHKHSGNLCVLFCHWFWKNTSGNKCHRNFTRRMSFLLPS